MFNKRTKYILLILAMMIIVSSLIFTNRLTSRLAQDERNKIELWSEAMNRFNDIDEKDNANFELIWKIIETNKSIPVIIADEDNNVISYVNLSESDEMDSVLLLDKIDKFKSENPPIELTISKTEKQYIYYDNSRLLKYLEIFPYVQLIIISLLLLVTFWAFFSEKKAEQNRIWIGLSKETAHQLGTPISSLMAWGELLKSEGVNSEILGEMKKDLIRLQMISDRFSKIGSTPVLKQENILEAIEHTIDYLNQRTSDKVEFYINTNNSNIYAYVNLQLFDWVIENICKNAVDAMGGIGQISFSIIDEKKRVIIDIKDTGKGILKKHFKSIFNPGFTTKKRGWGLGLSLSARIIEDYHKGEIFVKSSELNHGTTFRIVLYK